MLEKAEAPFRAKCDLLARVRVSSSQGGGSGDALEVLIMHMLPDNASKKTGVGSANGFHWLALQTLLWGGRAHCFHMGCWLQEAEASQQKFVRQRREFEELQAAHRALVRVAW